MLLIFDFDSTLEEFLPFETAVENDIFAKLAEKHLIDPVKLREVFDAIKHAYSHPRSVAYDYNRHVWFAHTFRIFHIDEPVHPWVQYYWDSLFSLVRVWPGTYEALEHLKQEHTLCILSDSDGQLPIKLARIEHLGLTKYFDHIFTSDAMPHNKPHPRMFLQVLEHYQVAAEECVMIGDAPFVDLHPAKELGMHTIWQKEGVPKEQVHEHHDFVDYEVMSIQEIPSVVARLPRPVHAYVTTPRVPVR